MLRELFPLECLQKAPAHSINKITILCERISKAIISTYHATCTKFGYYFCNNKSKAYSIFCNKFLLRFPQFSILWSTYLCQNCFVHLNDNLDSLVSFKKFNQWNHISWNKQSIILKIKHKENHIIQKKHNNMASSQVFHLIIIWLYINILRLRHQ